ncbi:hypothetical protein [Nocardia terpenica]|uniref:hypothetical protein n=1 Tax=Nocardia terpenica TaxID=455432 RepID=UPI002FE05D75
MSAEAVWVWFTRLLVDVGVDPVPPAATGSVFGDAVAAVAGAGAAMISRWPGIGTVSWWWLAAAASSGRLLIPAWP